MSVRSLFLASPLILFPHSLTQIMSKRWLSRRICAYNDFSFATRNSPDILNRDPRSPLYRQEDSLLLYLCR